MVQLDCVKNKNKVWRIPLRTVNCPKHPAAVTLILTNRNICQRSEKSERRSQFAFFMGVANNDWSGSRGVSTAPCAILFAVQRGRACTCQATELLSGALVCSLEKDKLGASVCSLETQLSWEAEQSVGRVWIWLHFIYGLNTTLRTPVCRLFPFITVTAAPDRVQSASADSHTRTDLSCNLSEMSHRHMFADLFMRLRKPAKCK